MLLKMFSFSPKIHPSSTFSCFKSIHAFIFYFVFSFFKIFYQPFLFSQPLASSWRQDGTTAERSWNFTIVHFKSSRLWVNFLSQAPPPVPSPSTMCAPPLLQTLVSIKKMPLLPASRLSQQGAALTFNLHILSLLKYHGSDFSVKGVKKKKQQLLFQNPQIFMMVLDGKKHRCRMRCSWVWAGKSFLKAQKKSPSFYFSPYAPEHDAGPTGSALNLPSTKSNRGSASRGRTHDPLQPS